MMANNIARPVLRYPGGKWKCAEWIISHFPRHEVCTSRSVTYAHPISREEHVELANVLNGCQGNVVISGYDSELYASLYAGWFTAVKKAISGMGKHRVEKIWIKRQENSLFNQGEQPFALTK